MLNSIVYDIECEIIRNSARMKNLPIEKSQERLGGKKEKEEETSDRRRGKYEREVMEGFSQA
jgi:hypothetical protein